MLHNILLSEEEQKVEKQNSINKFWNFVKGHDATIEEINGRLHLVLSGKNLDAFCSEYKDEDIVNLKLISGKLCVEVKWLCEMASDDEIRAGEQGLVPADDPVNEK